MPTKKPKTLDLLLDESVYPLEAVQNACYGFIDRVHARIRRAAGMKLRVSLTPKGGTSPARARPSELEGEFYNELLHHALRLKVSESNGKIREFIVTKALVSALPAPDAAVPPEGPRREPPLGRAPAPLDKELEAEIEKLLAEIEKGDADKDPLGVTRAWEDSRSREGDDPAAPPAFGGQPPAAEEETA